MESLNNLEVRLISTLDAAYQEVLSLREEVLRQPLGLSVYNDDLSRESQDFLLTVWDIEQLVGCVILSPLTISAIKLRAMAVVPKLQKHGIGRLLVHSAEALAFEKGFEKIVLNARVVAKGFYEKLGYDVISDEFIEVTLPHVKMQKLITKIEVNI